MRGAGVLLVVALMGGLAVGCGGSGKLQTRGRLVVNGAPFAAEPDDVVRVTFIPIPADGGRAMDYYIAAFDPATGTFRVVGKDGQGVPPGKYRIAVEQFRKKKDVLQGKFNGENSHFVFDVNRQTGELVLDLAKAS